MRTKVKERTQELFFSEIGINSYIDMINNLTGNSNEFVSPNAIQELIENDRATSLLSLSHDITLITNFGELLETMLKQLINISYSEGGCISMVNERKHLEVQVKNEIIEQGRLEFAVEISEYVFKKGLPLVINNVSDLKNITESDLPEGIDKLFILCVPIQADTKILGVCYLDNSLSASVFTDNTKNLIATFLAQAAIAMEHSFFKKRKESYDHNKQISSLTEEKINRAIEYLHINYTSNISREGLASILDIHPDSLGRYFKMITGKRINEYVNELRINKASESLKDEDVSIIEIAFSVGFESLTTFNRAFLKIMEMNPTEFRERFKKES